MEDFSDELLHEFAYSALGNLCPIQAFIGGVAAQEVMKASVMLLIIVNECLHACMPVPQSDQFFLFVLKLQP